MSSQIKKLFYWAMTHTCYAFFHILLLLSFLLNFFLNYTTTPVLLQIIPYPEIPKFSNLDIWSNTKVPKYSTLIFISSGNGWKVWIWIWIHAKFYLTDKFILVFLFSFCSQLNYFLKTLLQSFNNYFFIMNKL